MACRVTLLVCCLSLLASIVVARADAAFKVGVATRDFVPVEPYEWREAKTHALHVTIWYPAAAEAREAARWIGPPFVPFASAGSAALDAAPAAGPRRPLIVLSHGAGDTASGLAWFGTALAAQGFIVVAVDHPGNNAMADHTIEGYSLWWLRAADLSAVTTAVLEDKIFGSLVDRDRIGAAGHSAGGYTAIAVAGAVSEPARLEAFCTSPKADSSCRPSKDVSEMRQKSLARSRSDPDYRRRYGMANGSYRDVRVRAVFAMAPGLVQMFTPESLGQISIPVAIVAGTADEVVPSTSNGEFVAKAVPGATLKLIPHAGHFAFWDTCTMVGRIVLCSTCVDPGGIDRDAVHAQAIRFALDFFSMNLR